MSKLVIRTDHKWKPLRDRYEVPARVLRGSFDWDTEEDLQTGFIRYHREWMHLSEFTCSDPTLTGWDGVKNWSWSNGVVIKLSTDGEHYKIGYYYLA